MPKTKKNKNIQDCYNFDVNEDEKLNMYQLCFGVLVKLGKLKYDDVPAPGQQQKYC